MSLFKLLNVANVANISRSNPCFSFALNQLKNTTKCQLNGHSHKLTLIPTYANRMGLGFPYTLTANIAHVW